MHEPRALSALDSLLHLFETTLAEVPFPDVSAETLRAASDALVEQDDAVVSAEVALAAAREAQAEARRSYEKLGRRALAYAQIFAEGDASLGETLSGLASALSAGPRAAQSAEAPRRRGRPRKSETSLFASEGAESAPSTEGEEAA